MHLRTATYNIHHGRGTDEIIDLAGIAEILQQTGADIIGLQEVDQCTKRSSGVDQAAAIAQLLSFSGQFAAHFAYQGGSYGVAILTRFPIIAYKQYWLPTAPGCEARTLMQTTLDIHGVQANVYTTHLEVRNPIVRELQCNTVADVLELGTLPAILMGDMNAIPGDWDLKGRLARQLQDCDAENNQPTFPAGDLHKRIDYVLVSPHWSPIQVTIIDSIRSDHALVMADIELKNVPI